MQQKPIAAENYLIRMLIGLVEIESRLVRAPSSRTIPDLCLAVELTGVRAEATSATDSSLTREETSNCITV
jgi:hypothetical protein